MAQYDGSIKIDTKLENDELIKELQALGKMLESNLQKIIEDINRLAAKSSASSVAMTTEMNEVTTASENMSKEITAAADSAADLSEQQKDTAQAAQALSEAAAETAEAMQSLDQTSDSAQETLNAVDSAAASAADQVEQLGKTGEAADSGLKAVKNTVDSFADRLKNKLKPGFEAVTGTAKKLTDSARDLADRGFNKLRSGIDKVKAKFAPATAAFDKAKDKIKEVGSAGKDLADRGFNKLKSAIDRVKSKFKGLGDEEDKTSKKTSAFGDTVKAILTSDAIKAGLNLLWTGIKRIGQAFFDIGKQAIEAYGNYEQLVGGVETLLGAKGATSVEEYAKMVGKSVKSVKKEYESLKASEQTVLQNAQNAYKTAGLSANQYMETVTSFSASLLQGLGGDTKKAAALADVAVRDMSDNANKMGSDMESIQTAYQGFAKQNYTMLDNLKLGYGGTKEEMQRLLSDANKLNAAQGKHTKYSLNNFGDIVSAIHDVQVNMGIYGTTADEAEKTIQGSLNMTKAAWQNLLVGIADDEADFDGLINNLVESASAAGRNLLPRIESTINGIGKLIEKAAPVIMEKLPGVIANVAPSLISAANSLITGLIGAVIELGPTVMQAGTELLLTLVDGLVAGLPQLGNAAMAILTNLANGLANAAPTLIPAAVEAIIGFAMALIAPDNIGALIDSAIALIMGLADGIINALPILIDAIPDIIEALVEALIENAPQLLIASIELVLKLAEGILDAIPELVMVIPKVITAIYTAFKETNWQELGNHVIDGLINGIGAKIVVIIAKIQDLGNAIKKKFCDFFGIHSPSTLMATMGGYLVDGLVNGVKNMPQKVIAIFSNLKSQITSWGSGVLSTVKSIGGNLVTGLWNGLNDKVGWITSKIKGFGSSVLNAIKKTLGINSPSKITTGYGGYLAQGLNLGFQKEMPKVRSGLLGDIKAMTGRMQAVVSLESGRLAANVSGGNHVNNSSVTNNTSYSPTMNFYQPIQTPSQVARATRRALEVR